VATCIITRRKQPRFRRRNGPRRFDRVSGSTPFNVGTILAAMPMIMSEMNPTVIACRVAPK